MSLDDPTDRSVAAGEFVLGTLSPADRAAFEQALAGDAALRAEVYRWQDRLLPLAGGVAPCEPAPDLWSRIEAGLPRAPSAPIADPDTPAANDPLWQRLRRWRAVSALAIAASVLLASALVLRAPGPTPVHPDRYLALLQSPDRSTGWVVEVTAGDKVRLVPVGTTDAVPPGKSLQFWTKAEGAAGPTSLGLIRPGQVTELPAARLPAVGERTLFELTLEPQAGSPIGRPTGPVLFVGRTVRM
jgi:anti-sigma-K factor RskA